ncbi:MAG: hypothetical protein QM690_16775 [Sphingobium sp.]
MRVWSYVIRTDRGSAPNYDGPAVTLTICKPRIRKRAQKGDLVLAFNGKTLARNPHSVRWAGIVSDVLSLEEYWDDPRFRGKRPDRSETPDNIYQMIDGQLFQVENSSHDAGNIATDIRGKNALIFEQAWHMGDSAPELPEIFDLRVVSNRRLEPLREISPEEWSELQGWLKAYDCGLPRHKKGSRCVPRQSVQRKPVKC